MSEDHVDREQPQDGVGERDQPTPAFLLEQVYDQLRKLAAGYFRDERAAHTLQPTALVHEAWLRLAAQDNMTWHNERQFAVLAARAMRNILVDHARGRGRLKRGGDWQRLSLDGLGGKDNEQQQVDLLALDEALSQLSELDPTKARLVELRYFAGMPLHDAAAALGMARSTAAEHWRMARAWLHNALEGGAA